MSYIRNVSATKEVSNVYPWAIPGYQFSHQANFSSNVILFTGDNGIGKSTLLETIGLKLQEQHLLNTMPELDEFEPARILVDSFTLEFNSRPANVEYIRAEELGRDIEKYNQYLSTWIERMDLKDIKNEPHVRQLLKNEFKYLPHSTHGGIKHKYEACSQGEAYLDRLCQSLDGNGLYLLDEPEAALSPLKQIMLICMIREHITRHKSQIIVATHSPILLATPGAIVNEIEELFIKEKEYKETEHYQLTLGFLQNPERYLRYLE